MRGHKLNVGWMMMMMTIWVRHEQVEDDAPPIPPPPHLSPENEFTICMNKNFMSAASKSFSSSLYCIHTNTVAQSHCRLGSQWLTQHHDYNMSCRVLTAAAAATINYVYAVFAERIIIIIICIRVVWMCRYLISTVSKCEEQVNWDCLINI